MRSLKRTDAPQRDSAGGADAQQPGASRKGTGAWQRGAARGQRRHSLNLRED